jgi:MerR family redox-sensitive transcriptional activator SoxR
MGENGLVPIGELARRTGVATSALRYYERIGLLPLADRLGQRRQYPAVCVERVALIRLYQNAGFTLAEIGRLLAAMSLGRPAWDQLAERKVVKAGYPDRGRPAGEETDQARPRVRASRPPRCPNFRAALEAQLDPRR